MISLETPLRKWTSCRLEGRTFWIFSSCCRCSRLAMGNSETRSFGHRKGQTPRELLGGLFGILSRRWPGLRPCVESVPETEVSSPVLTWILGDFWCLPRGVSPHLHWGHAGAISSRAVAAVSRLHSPASRYLWISLEAFPRGFPTTLSHDTFPQGCPTYHRGVSRASA